VIIKVSPDAVVVAREDGHGAFGFGVTLAASLRARREDEAPFLVWLKLTEAKMVRSNSVIVNKLFR
jgi:hypothetical protein